MIDVIDKLRIVGNLCMVGCENGLERKKMRVYLQDIENALSALPDKPREEADNG